MIKKIQNFVRHPLFGGSAVMIIGSNLANVIAYLYHLIIGRMLGPANYGELSSVISLLGLLFTSFNFLGLVIVKFISSAKEDEIPYMFRWFVNKSLYIAGGIALVLFLVSPKISDFLHIHISLAFLIAPIVFFAFLVFIYRSFAQGLMKFWSIVISMNIDLIVRLSLGVALIILGFSVFGTVLGITISTFLTFVYLKWTTRKNTVGDKVAKISLGTKVGKYALPILIATLTTNSMISTDVLLVKHFFDAQSSGIYASVSTLGRIIFYGTGPVSAVMFPLISKRQSQNKSSHKIFYLSLFLTFAICLTVTIIYFVFPELSVKILFGDKYLEGTRYLGLFAVFMSLFALASLVFNYFLSIEKTSVVFFSVLAAIMQVSGIILWHENFMEVIYVSIGASAFFLTSLILMYRNHITKDLSPAIKDADKDGN